MNPEVRLNEDEGVYELGFEAEGAFIVLQTVQTSFVQSRIAAAAEAQQQQQTDSVRQQPQTETPPPPPPQ